MNVFNQILDVHAPVTQMKYSKQQNKRNAKPWITPDILKMIKLKVKTYQKLVKEKIPPLEYNSKRSIKNKKRNNKYD